MPRSSFSPYLLTNNKHDISFSLISQCGFNQKPFLSQITSTLTYEFDRSLPIKLEIWNYENLDETNRIAQEIKKKIF